MSGFQISPSRISDTANTPKTSSSNKSIDELNSPDAAAFDEINLDMDDELPSQKLDLFDAFSSTQADEDNQSKLHSKLELSDNEIRCCILDLLNSDSVYWPMKT